MTPHIYNGPYSVSQTISKIRSEFQILDKNLYKAVVDPNPSNKKQFIESLNKYIESLSSHFTKDGIMYVSEVFEKNGK